MIDLVFDRCVGLCRLLSLLLVVLLLVVGGCAGAVVVVPVGVSFCLGLCMDGWARASWKLLFGKGRICWA